MKKKIKIGVPRGLLYYRRYIFWKSYFEKIGFTVILSELTNKSIIDRGNTLSVDESCLPFKIYLGHISSIIDKCDYVLIPRICNYGKKKRACIRFNGVYDVASNIFGKDKILDYNIDYLKGKYFFTEMIRIGFKFNKNIFKLLYSYFTSIKKEKEYNYMMIRKNMKALRSNKLKILIVSHPYIIYDNYLGNDIINYLKKEDIEIVYSDRVDKKESILYAEEFSDTLYFLYSKEIIGTSFMYKNAVDGIIFLSSFPCGPDSIVNELAIRKLDNIPIINIILDESSATSGLYTRLESFIDIVKVRNGNG